MALIATGDRLSPARLALLAPMVARKPGATARSSTTLHSSDPDLSVPVGTNRTYMGRATLFTSSSASGAGDLSISFGFPSGSDYSIGAHGLPDSLGSGQTADLFAKVIEGTATTSGTIEIGTSSSFTLVTVELVVVTGATAGNVTLRWAQANSNANATAIRKNSVLALWAVA